MNFIVYLIRIDLKLIPSLRGMESAHFSVCNKNSGGYHEEIIIGVIHTHTSR
jgi:hypothetical protein